MSLSLPWPPVAAPSLAAGFALFFLPIAFLAKKIYAWMSLDPHTDHALHTKQPLLSMPGFYLVAALCFLTWWVLSHCLRKWSLRQDETGAAARAVIEKILGETLASSRPTHTM